MERGRENSHNEGRWREEGRRRGRERTVIMRGDGERKGEGDNSHNEGRWREEGRRGGERTVIMRGDGEREQAQVSHDFKGYIQQYSV